MPNGKIKCLRRKENPTRTLKMNMEVLKMEANNGSIYRRYDISVGIVLKSTKIVKAKNELNLFHV